jgi:hypothetical protein
VRGFWRLDPFSVRGLGGQQVGLIGGIDEGQDDCAIIYLWRVANAVFTVAEDRPNNCPGLRVPRRESTLRQYAREISQRARKTSADSRNPEAVPTPSSLSLSGTAQATS